MQMVASANQLAARGLCRGVRCAFRFELQVPVSVHPVSGPQKSLKELLDLRRNLGNPDVILLDRLENFEPTVGCQPGILGKIREPLCFRAGGYGNAGSTSRLGVKINS